MGKYYSPKLWLVIYHLSFNVLLLSSSYYFYSLLAIHPKSEGELNQI